MTRTRALLPAALLLAGGCVSVPSGIVDNFVPPQGQTVVTEVRTPLCDDSEPDRTGSDETITPCVPEVVAVAAAGPPPAVPTGYQRNRPRPPRMPRH